MSYPKYEREAVTCLPDNVMPSKMPSAEQLHKVLSCRIGDRKRLDAQLLLRLQSGQAGRGFFHVRVDHRADASLQRVGLLGQEVVLRFDPPPSKWPA